MRWKKRHELHKEWHPYFTWFPVTVDDEVVWLETIMRRKVFIQLLWQWEYKI